MNARKSNYRRGSELITPKEFNREYKALIAQELREIRRDNRSSRAVSTVSFADFLGVPFDCSADGLRLPSYVLHRHCAMIGTTGVGKSTLIKWYLDYCRMNREKVIIPDVNGEYAAEFFRPGDTVLSLFDTSSAFWTFESESIDSAEFAKFLVPTGDEHGKFWWKGARQVVSQLLDAFKDPKALWAILNDETSDISANLTGLARKIAGKEGTTQAAGITGTSILILVSDPLERLGGKQRQHHPFPIYDWTQDDSRWGSSRLATQTRRYQSAVQLWINTAITGLPSEPQAVCH